MKRYYYCCCNSQDTKRMQDVRKQALFMYKTNDYALWTLFGEKAWGG